MAKGRGAAFNRPGGVAGNGPSDAVRVGVLRKLSFVLLISGGQYYAGLKDRDILHAHILRDLCRSRLEDGSPYYGFQLFVFINLPAWRQIFPFFGHGDWETVVNAYRNGYQNNLDKL